MSTLISTSRQSKRRGFTLLETVVALTLLVAAAIGPISLASRGLFSAKFSRSRIIALNLAQEGAELVHTMRDNNLLNIAAGCTFRGGSGASCANLSDGQYEVDAFDAYETGGDDLELQPSASRVLRYTPSNAFYTYESFPDSLDTPYIRTITISTLPAESGASPILVESRVSWMESGISRQARVESRLYPWQ
jgi:prepilin-type N-terminal cleavage/methylation domain-containing protein